eukprot:CAMPEP_0119535132 /NCGR_PEP_ID=MMETSP1344-20130328/48235_1 /TAXON_ID=236787 /ORGANISM="Florenciella parvula, Strain CCMP2471" /LENGTH=54 /DNA_ID=CAMNT_0007576627 /DNA_START=3 /DNA_END=163 /DNA_ORIENTATION=+
MAVVAEQQIALANNVASRMQQVRTRSGLGEQQRRRRSSLANAPTASALSTPRPA